MNKKKIPRANIRLNIVQFLMKIKLIYVLSRSLSLIIIIIIIVILLNYSIVINLHCNKTLDFIYSAKHYSNDKRNCVQLIKGSWNYRSDCNARRQLIYYFSNSSNKMARLYQIRITHNRQIYMLGEYFSSNYIKIYHSTSHHSRFLLYTQSSA
jgi:hypothetical protein